MYSELSEKINEYIYCYLIHKLLFNNNVTADKCINVNTSQDSLPNFDRVRLNFNKGVPLKLIIVYKKAKISCNLTINNDDKSTE